MYFSLGESRERCSIYVSREACAIAEDSRERELKELEHRAAAKGFEAAAELSQELASDIP